MILPHKSIPAQPMLINFKEHSFSLSSCDVKLLGFQELRFADCGVKWGSACFCTETGFFSAKMRNGCVVWFYLLSSRKENRFQL